MKLNMKNKLFLILMIAFLASCDEMLDVTPKTDMVDSKFWLSETHFKSASNMLYYQLPSKGRDYRGDDLITRGDMNNISAGRRNVPGLSNDWTDPYRRIANANNIIENAQKSPVGESIRNRYLGEALLFRAWWHFDLVCKYGDVPLVLKTFSAVSDPDLKMGRTPREEVIQQCYEDLRTAAEYLPTRAALVSVTDELDRRRATRSSALGLMVRIGLHEGTMGKYHNLNNNWQSHLDICIQAFEDLKREGHQLYTGDGAYAYLGALYEEQNDLNLEIIFGKAHGPNGTTGANATFSNTNFSTDCQEGSAVTRKMIDMYLYADGLPGEKSEYYLPPREETAFNSVFGFEADGVTSNGHPRDPRFTLSFWRENDPDQEAGVEVAGYEIGWRLRRAEAFNHYYNTSRHDPAYHQKKGHVGTFMKNAGTNGDNNDNILIRWGEMLISYAEALYERNGSISDDQLEETVNALRARAKFNVKLTNDFVRSNDLNMLEEIRRERTVELIAEGRRYPDLIRWKTAEVELPKPLVGLHYFRDTAIEDALGSGLLTDADGKFNGVFVYDAENIFVWEPASVRFFNPARDYYYPIPTNEIAKSEGNIKQNPNWREDEE